MAELADLIRERRRRRLEAAGLPFLEPPPLPPDYEGRRLGIAETLRARREERLMEATRMKGKAMKSNLFARLKRLETARAAEERDRPLKVELAYLKLLPREYSGPRHIVSVGKRPDGRCEYE